MVYFPMTVLKISNLPLVVGNLKALLFCSPLHCSSTQPASCIKTLATVFLVIFVHPLLLCLSFNFLPSLDVSQSYVSIPLSFPSAGPFYR